MRSFFALGLLLLSAANLASQEEQKSEAATSENNYIVLVTTRILEGGQLPVLETSARQRANFGHTASFKMVGSNIVILSHFTPLQIIETQSYALLAQGEIWLADNKGNVRYFSSIRTIPMNIGEPVLFFPLGQKISSADQGIEIKIEILEEKNEDTEEELQEEIKEEH